MTTWYNLEASVTRTQAANIFVSSTRPALYKHHIIFACFSFL